MTDSYRFGDEDHESARIFELRQRELFNFEFLKFLRGVIWVQNKKIGNKGAPSGQRPELQIILKM